MRGARGKLEYAAKRRAPSCGQSSLHEDATKRGNHVLVLLSHSRYVNSSKHRSARCRTGVARRAAPVHHARHGCGQRDPLPWSLPHACSRPQSSLARHLCHVRRRSSEEGHRDIGRRDQPSRAPRGAVVPGAHATGILPAGRPARRQAHMRAITALSSQGISVPEIQLRDTQARASPSSYRPELEVHNLNHVVERQLNTLPAHLVLQRCYSFRARTAGSASTSSTPMRRPAGAAAKSGCLVRRWLSQRRWRLRRRLSGTSRNT